MNRLVPLCLLVALSPACALDAGEETEEEEGLSDQEAAGAPTLRLSLASDRSGARSLDGAAVSRSIYVFVGPTEGIARVRFYIDGALRHTENDPPFDLAGTTSPGQIAKPFDTRTLNNGLHSIRADVDRCSTGCTLTLRALVSVQNTIVHPKAFGVAGYWPDGPADIGARWLRTDFNWAGHEPDPTRAIVPIRDELVLQAQERNIKVLAVLAYAPRWARSDACKDDYKCEPRSAQLYVDWVRDMVRHYRDVGPTHARVHAWELWNEENSDFFWAPDPNPALYAQMVIGAYAAIKAEDPDALVVLGGFSGSPSYVPDPDSHVMDPRQFLAQLYQHGIAGHYDAVVHHPYSFSNANIAVDQVDNWYLMFRDETFNTPSGPVLAKSLRRQMIEHGDGDKPIWNTEYGAPSPITLRNGAVIDEQKQADLIVQAMNLWKTYPWAGLFITFTYKDFNSNGTERDDHMGLIRSTDGTPGCTATGQPTGTAKKAYCAFLRYPK